ncbi:MAG: hypothetical protein AAGA48_25010 [Myxococcota bacterium]
MQLVCKVLAVFMAMAWFSACQWTPETVSNSPGDDPIDVEPNPRSAVDDVRIILAEELALESDATPSGKWSEIDRQHLHTMLLALEIHEIWGYSDETPVRGRYTPELATHLRSRIAEYGGTEPVVVLGVFMDRLDLLVDAGILLD